MLAKGIGELERATGRIFGDARLPLFVSVRSGAARSMPGMLDTISEYWNDRQNSAWLDSAYGQSSARLG